MIIEFQGPNRFLSNFYPVIVSLDGFKYPTVEDAYQAAKCRFRDDRSYILSAITPGEAKKRGRQVAIRPDWDNVKIHIMEKLIREKFSLEPLRTKLLETGDQDLIEGNRWGDTFWGVCNGRGENHLGKLLMAVREELQEGSRS